MLTLATTAPTVEADDPRARLKEIADAVTQLPDALDEHIEEIITLAVGAPWPLSDTARRMLLDAFEDFRAAWEENDDFQEGRLCVSQIDPDLTGPGADVAAAEMCEQNVEEELTHLLKILHVTPSQTDADGGA